jgi:ABC-2 type transport system permease protein
LSIYRKLISVSVRTQFEYRLAYAMQAMNQFLGTAVEFVGLWALFERFGSLGSWTLGEAAVFYGMANVGFSVADAICRGFDTFAGQVKSGDFDRVLLRPRSTVLQIAGREFALKRIGRLLQGAAVLAWGLTRCDLTTYSVVVIPVGLAATAGLFSGLMILQATMAFWTTESLEMMNIVTHGGVQTAQYPLSIYVGGLRKLFMYVVPLGPCLYYPLLIAMGKADPLGAPWWVGFITPLTAPAFLVIALFAWRAGVRHYTSTGS